MARSVKRTQKCSLKKGQLWCKSNADKLWSGSNEVQIVTCCCFILKNWKQQLINSKLETDIPVTEGLQIYTPQKRQSKNISTRWDPTSCCCFRNTMVFLQRETMAMSSRGVTRCARTDASVTADQDWTKKKKNKNPQPFLQTSEEREIQNAQQNSLPEKV